MTRRQSRQSVIIQDTPGSSRPLDGATVAYGLVLDGELTFVPGEIPRRGVFALWGTGSGHAELGLVFPRGSDGIGSA